VAGDGFEGGLCTFPSSKTSNSRPSLSSRPFEKGDFGPNARNDQTPEGGIAIRSHRGGQHILPGVGGGQFGIHRLAGFAQSSDGPAQLVNSGAAMAKSPILSQTAATSLSAAASSMRWTSVARQGFMSPNTPDEVGPSGVLAFDR